MGKLSMKIRSLRQQRAGLFILIALLAGPVSSCLGIGDADLKRILHVAASGIVVVFGAIAGACDPYHLTLMLSRSRLRCRSLCGCCGRSRCGFRRRFGGRLSRRFRCGCCSGLRGGNGSGLLSGSNGNDGRLRNRGALAAGSRGIQSSGRRSNEKYQYHEAAEGTGQDLRHAKGASRFARPIRSGSAGRTGTDRYRGRNRRGSVQLPTDRLFPATGTGFLHIG